MRGPPGVGFLIEPESLAVRCLACAASRPKHYFDRPAASRLCPRRGSRCTRSCARPCTRYGRERQLGLDATLLPGGADRPQSQHLVAEITDVGAVIFTVSKCS